MSDPSDPGIDFLTPTDPVDLDNCAREPIHVPGSVQPHGVLIAVRESDQRVLQVSTSVLDVFGVPVERALAGGLAEVLGEAAASVIARHVMAFTDLRERNPLLVEVPGPDGPVVTDAVLHRLPGPSPDRNVLVVELEVAQGPRPFDFPNTYQAVRQAVVDLNRAVELDALYEIAVRHLRDLTGFDRVMIYRFDRDYNGEVVAEARRPDLNAFLGLHYPASDIPPQARALYEKNWVRLIADVGYAPSPIVPRVNPELGAELDLTYAHLRSVSPIHVEYLSNMGVAASMSISLMREGRLWGLVACHHYSGPHFPPYAVRAAAEFLGSTLSLRFVERAQAEEATTALRSESVMAALVLAAGDEDRRLGPALLDTPGLLDLVPADGVYVRTAVGKDLQGRTPAVDTLPTLSRWILEQGSDVVHTDRLEADAPDVHAALDDVAGVLALVLPGEQLLVWLRGESVRNVDWGGDPHNKALMRREGDEVRISPRRSFDRWREIVRGRSVPWTPQEIASAERLRTHLLEVLYTRSRQAMRAAEMLQRSLLPQVLPEMPGWSLEAHYSAAAGGWIGGDWYDAVPLADGRVAVLVGDVAGHGVDAAATMAQLRYVLRGFLLRGDDPRSAVGALDSIVAATLPDQMATLVMAVVDPETRVVEVASLGHLPPLVASPVEGVHPAPVEPWTPLGIGFGPPDLHRFVLPEGGILVLYTDGLVERRDESIQVGQERLRAAIAAGTTEGESLTAAVRDRQSTDDSTVVVVRHLPPA